jgi:hypothetical protein
MNCPVVDGKVLIRDDKVGVKFLSIAEAGTFGQAP